MSRTNFKGSAMLNPVPVVLVTSKNSEGKVNVFTAGWVGTACTRPPIISLAIRPERLSYEYIKETGEFVVNLPSKDLVKAVDFFGVKSGRELDKLKHFNLNIEESTSIQVPSIKECPVALECKLKDIIKLGSHDLFLGEVTNVQVEDFLIDEKGKIHYEKANLMSYCHGEYYPLPEKSIGKFGFSVQKKKKRK